MSMRFIKKFENHIEPDVTIETIFDNIRQEHERLVDIVTKMISEFFKKNKLESLQLSMISPDDSLYSGLVEVTDIVSGGAEFKGKVTEDNREIFLDSISISYLDYNALYELYQLIDGLDTETIIAILSEQGHTKEAIDVIKANIIDFEKEVNLTYSSKELIDFLSDGLLDDDEVQEAILDYNKEFFNKCVTDNKFRINKKILDRRRDDVIVLNTAKNTGLI